MGCLFKLDNGIRDLEGVVGSLVGLCVGANDGIRLGFHGVDGAADGFGVGTVEVGRLVGSNGGSVI